MCVDWIMNSKQEQKKRWSFSSSTTTPMPVSADLLSGEKTDKHLICDDSTYNRLVLKRYLSVLSIEVDEADSGEEALRLIRQNGEYAIIWMDVRMGTTMNGAECTKRLRKDMGYTGKIIALTGYVDEKTYAECMTSGLDHFLSKPFNRESVAMYSKKYRHFKSYTPPPSTKTQKRSSVSVMETPAEHSSAPAVVATEAEKRRHTFFSYVSTSRIN
jgi:CheY-like chemotaxis protein